MKSYSIFLLLIILIMIGCSRHLNLSSTENPEIEYIENLDNVNKTFIIHSGERVYVLKSTRITNDSLVGKILMPDSIPDRFRNLPEGGIKMRLNYSSDTYKFLNECHVHLKANESTRQEIEMAVNSGSQFSISINNISRVDVYDYPSKKINRSRVKKSVITIGIGTALVYLLMLATTF